MPYCPKCKMDFVKGITVCTDCGGLLIDDEETERQLRAAEDEKNKYIMEQKINGFASLVIGCFLVGGVPAGIGYIPVLLALTFLSIVAGMLFLLSGCGQLYAIFLSEKEGSEEILKAGKFNLWAAVFGSLWLACQQRPIAGGIFWIIQYTCTEAVRVIIFVLGRSGHISDNQLFVLLELGTGFVLVLFHILLGFWAKRITVRRKKAFALVVCAALVIGFA